jgi:hypothetical protein
MNVADWLSTLGLGQYEAAFRDNSVTATDPSVEAASCGHGAWHGRVDGRRRGRPNR